MGCTCANNGRQSVQLTTRPHRLFVFSDDERIGRQLELLGHSVFVVRPARHPEGATTAMLDRFHADGVITDRTDGSFGSLPRMTVRIPTPCPDCAPHAHQPAIADALTDAVAALPATGSTNRRNVIISGYYGAKNTGDNLLLESIAQALTAVDPSIEVSVAATNPIEVERAHGLPAFSRKDLDTIAPHLDTCSAFVLGGGGLWNDYNFNELGGVAALFGSPIASIPGWTQTQLLAQSLGVRTHAYGLGVGPLTDEGARALVHLAAVGMDSITVRDAASVALLAELDIAADVAPDPVYAWNLPTADAPPVLHRYVAVNLRDWQFAEAGYLARLRSAITDRCRETGAGVVGVPMQPSDVKTLQAFLGTLPDDVDTTTLRWQHDPLPIISALAHADVVVAMRLHTCLLAHRLGRGVVGLCYDPKVTEHFRELGREAVALPLDCDEASMVTAIRTAADGVPTATTKRITALESAARAGLQALAERIATTVPKQVPADRNYARMTQPIAAPRKGFLRRLRG